MKRNKLNMRISKIKLLSIGILATTAMFAKQFSSVGKVSGSASVTASGCLPASSQIDLDINNVRARILGGGDMWWDQGLAIARYEIPKDSKKYALFAGSLWMGGIDAGGQLKVAAQTYRQTGNDLWPGPLSNDNVASTDKSVCDLYNKHWKINKADVEKFLSDRADNSSVTAPASLLAWPGNQVSGTPANYDNYLAPFYDADGNGLYEPSAGDYPKYNFSADPGTGDCDEFLFGDQTIWWVINDKGNIHTETGANAIGIEIQCQAFGFQTGDEINNMSFYQYKIINRSSYTMNNTYFGLWVDADLGNAYDDAVGCDVPRGVAFTYNFDEDDETTIGYGASPPAVGIDFFKGPKADPYLVNGVLADRPASMSNNGLGFGDGQAGNEYWGMEKCIVFQNNSTAQGNPFNGTHIYNYLRGLWKDGTPMTYGGNGTGGTPTNYMYPWNTDPAHTADAPWFLSSTADLRTVQSAGPFTLEPGAVNYITAGAVWARANSTAIASVAAVIAADKKAQSLFDNCFKIVDGPDAPLFTLQELDQEIIMTLDNPISQNNYREGYKEKSPDITNYYPAPNSDPFYRFEGYKIYQLANSTVTIDNLNDPSLAQLVAQCDLKNGVGTLINKVFNPITQNDDAFIKVEGEDKGIRHSFKFTEDAFNRGSKLVNYKKYYFTVVAYAHNNYITTDDSINFNYNAQREPYLQGRRKIFTKLGIPHITANEQFGTLLQSKYGDGPEITRLEGQGNGGNYVELSQKTIDDILSASAPEKIYDMSAFTPVRNITYKGGKGPIGVKVVDPLNVPDAEFEVYVVPQDSFYAEKNSSIKTGIKNANEKATYAKWYIVKTQNNSTDTVFSDTSLVYNNEQIIEKWGLSVSISQVTDPGSNSKNDNNGFISSSITYSGDGRIWLETDRVRDQDGSFFGNWIRSGTTAPTTGTSYPEASYGDWDGFDDNQVYENVVNGTFAPYRLATNEPFGPGLNIGKSFNNVGGSNIYGTTPGYKASLTNKIQNIAGVDIVITSDKSKWSRCAVIETGFEQQFNEFDPSLNLKRSPIRGELRGHHSVDKDGKESTDTIASNDPNSPNFISAFGMSWFPGYAINVETGERLNIAFGESSQLPFENGRDMLWNPSTVGFNENTGKYSFGGLHYVYVFNHNSFTTEASTVPQNPTKPNGQNLMPPYDGCRYMVEKLRESSKETNITTGNFYTLKQVWRDCIWTGITALAQDHSLFENDINIKIRVNKPYARFFAGNSYNYQYSNPNPITGQYYNYDSENKATVSDGSAKNNNDPSYKFSTKDIAAMIGKTSIAKNALDLINAVPNPYYGYSEYEQSQIDNIVKITNLPVKCTVSIYTVNGTLIRRIDKDNDDSYLDWDLKNQSNVPIGSGMYLIHVNVPDVGEKTLKWFGSLRPVDLNAF